MCASTCRTAASGLLHSGPIAPAQQDGCPWTPGLDQLSSGKGSLGKAQEEAKSGQSPGGSQRVKREDRLGEGVSGRGARQGKAGGEHVDSSGARAGASGGGWSEGGKRSGKDGRGGPGGPGKADTCPGSSTCSREEVRTRCSFRAWEQHRL